MSTTTGPAEASNLSFAQTYILASKVKNKLTKEAANPKSLLWNLVVQANMFDNLMDHITKETEKRARERSASTPRRVSFLLPKKETVSAPEYLSPLARSAASQNYTHQSHVTEYEVAADSSESEDEDDYYYSDEEEDEEILHRGASLQVEALGHAVTTYELSVDLADSDSDSDDSDEDDYYYSESDEEQFEQDISFGVPTPMYRYPLSRNNSTIGLSSIQEEYEEDFKGPEEIDLSEITTSSSAEELPELTRSVSSSDLESEEEHLHHRHHNSTYIEPVVTKEKALMSSQHGDGDNSKYEDHHQHGHHHRHTNAIYTIESVF